MAMYLDTSLVFSEKMHPLFSCLPSTHLEKTQLPIDADFVQEGCIILNKVARSQLEVIDTYCTLNIQVSPKHAFSVSSGLMFLSGQLGNLKKLADLL